MPRLYPPIVLLKFLILGSAFAMETIQRKKTPPETTENMYEEDML